MTTPTPMTLEQQVASLSAAVERYQSEYHNKRRELEESNEAYALLFKEHGKLQRELAAAQEARDQALAIARELARLACCMDAIPRGSVGTQVAKLDALEARIGE